MTYKWSELPTESILILFKNQGYEKREKMQLFLPRESKSIEACIMLRKQTSIRKNRLN